MAHAAPQPMSRLPVRVVRGRSIPMTAPNARYRRRPRQPAPPAIPRCADGTCCNNRFISSDGTSCMTGKPACAKANSVIRAVLACRSRRRHRLVRRTKCATAAAIASRRACAATAADHWPRSATPSGSTAVARQTCKAQRGAAARGTAKARCGSAARSGVPRRVRRSALQAIVSKSTGVSVRGRPRSMEKAK